MEALLANGENEQALIVGFERIAQLSPAKLDVLRSAPNWPARVNAAHTVLREGRTPAEYEFDPARFADMITPTLLLTGGESPQWAKDATDSLNDALPNSRIVVLDGHRVT